MRIALIGCVIVGLLSLAIPTGLGYDPWAWMVWGRELAHLDLHTDGGPSWKPLPALLVALFTPIKWLAPNVWLLVARTAGLAAFVFAWRIAVRVGGTRVAGVAAVAGLAVCADIFVTTLRGYSEPLLIALVLAAVDQYQVDRPRAALALLALAGLLRPEVWPFSALLGAYLIWRRRDVAWAIALVAVAPVIWLGLDLAGSGNALEASTIAQSAPAGSASKAASPTLTVFARAGDAVVLPVLVVALAALAYAAWRRDRPLLWLAALPLAWIIEIAILAEGGFAGRRRYLIVAAALTCVLAGAGLGRAKAPRPALIAAAVVFAAFAFVPLRADWRNLGLARDQHAQLTELQDVVEAADRPPGRAVINPYLQTALAWELEVRLAAVRGPTHSTRAHPGWTPPATVYRAPPGLAGTVPAFPPGSERKLLAHEGRWRAYAAR